MVSIKTLLDENKISRLNELEKQRYLNFLVNSYKDNLSHAIYITTQFPRWSIISGYYAMHDISKLLLAKEFNIKIEREVHATTVKLLKEIIKNNEISKLIEEGYDEFLSLASDLNEARKERTKTQYYTGSQYMKAEFEKRAKNFIKSVVEPYIEKIQQLLNEK